MSNFALYIKMAVIYIVFVSKTIYDTIKTTLEIFAEMCVGVRVCALYCLRIRIINCLYIMG